ncbi:hypothetical protein WJX84_000738 [Apatococcus fuscideae]|uniref:Uncharacterized protein n=1 Tax=Apatococcus fuscideae TaxID=2026836 RepID=A0AAW1SZG6_9CHLO
MIITVLTTHLSPLHDYRRVKMLFEALEGEEPAVMYLATLGADEFVWVDRSASSLPSDFGTIIVAPAFGNLYSTACEQRHAPNRVKTHQPRICQGH